MPKPKPVAAPVRSRRGGNRRWKRIIGIDRKFTARVERAKERGVYTPPVEAR